MPGSGIAGRVAALQAADTGDWSVVDKSTGADLQPRTLYVDTGTGKAFESKLQPGDEPPRSFPGVARANLANWPVVFYEHSDWAASYEWHDAEE